MGLITQVWDNFGWRVRVVAVFRDTCQFYQNHREQSLVFMSCYISKLSGKYVSQLAIRRLGVQQHLTRASAIRVLRNTDSRTFTHKVLSLHLRRRCRNYISVQKVQNGWIAEHSQHAVAGHNVHKRNSLRRQATLSDSPLHWNIPFQAKGAWWSVIWHKPWLCKCTRIVPLPKSFSNCCTMSIITSTTRSSSTVSRISSQETRPRERGCVYGSSITLLSSSCFFILSSSASASVLASMKHVISSYYKQDVPVL